MSRHGSDWNPRCSDSVVSQWKDEGEQARGGGGGDVPRIRSSNISCVTSSDRTPSINSSRVIRASTVPPSAARGRTCTVTGRCGRREVISEREGKTVYVCFGRG